MSSKSDKYAIRSKKKLISARKVPCLNCMKNAQVSTSHNFKKNPKDKKEWKNQKTYNNSNWIFL